MIYGSLAGVKLFASSIKKITDSTQSIVTNHDQHKISKLEEKKLKLEIDAMKHEQEYKKKIEDIEYQKSIAELKKINLEIEDMEKQSDSYKKILLENDIAISVRHTSKNLKTVPLQEMIQYNH